MKRRLVPSLAVGVIACSAVMTGCGGSGDGSSARTPVEQAQAAVDLASAALDEAQGDLAASSEAFCADAEELITVVDRYGQLLQADRVTVGEVQTAADDLASDRKASGSSADQAVEDQAAVIDAQAALEAAEADLTNAQAAEKGQSTTTVAASSTTTVPLVPAETVARVTSAETALRSTAKEIDADTPVVEAGVRLSSAAFAVEVAWLRLFADAGCLSDEAQAEAVDAVVAYTTALQQALTAAGYYDGPIDGTYGPATVTAVEALQKAAQLPVTGLVDPATERALDAAVTQKAGSAAAGISARTAGIQGGLKALGYWDGPVDGKPSAALTEAVAKLQGDLGLEPTGVVDPATLDAIARTVDDAKQPTTTTTPSTTPDSSTTTTPATTTAPG